MVGMKTYTFAEDSAIGPDRTVPREIQPPRPPNAWILYRADKVKQLPPPPPGAPRRSQGEVSKLISRQWREATDAIKAEYEKRAEVKKSEHQARYPFYRFQPAKKATKSKPPQETRSKRATPYSTRARTQPVPVQYTGVEQNAPSPPLSAASSPRSYHNPLPPLPFDLRASTRAQSTSSVTSSSATGSSGSGNVQPPSAITDWAYQAYSWDSTAQPIPTSGSLQESLENQRQFTIEPLSEIPSHVTFDMPALTEQQDWTVQDGSMDYMQAMLSATGDPSVFQVSHDTSLLTNEPPEGFDLCYAPITPLNAWPTADSLSQVYDHREDAHYHNTAYDISPQYLYPQPNHQLHDESHNDLVPSHVPTTLSTHATTASGSSLGHAGPGDWPPLHYDNNSTSGSTIDAPGHWGIRTIS